MTHSNGTQKTLAQAPGLLYGLPCGGTPFVLAGVFIAGLVRFLVRVVKLMETHGNAFMPLRGV